MSCGCRPRNGSAAVSRLVRSVPCPRLRDYVVRRRWRQSRVRSWRSVRSRPEPSAASGSNGDALAGTADRWRRGATRASGPDWRAWTDPGRLHPPKRLVGLLVGLQGAGVREVVHVDWHHDVHRLALNRPKPVLTSENAYGSSFLITVLRYSVGRGFEAGHLPRPTLCLLNCRPTNSRTGHRQRRRADDFPPLGPLSNRRTADGRRESGGLNRAVRLGRGSGWGAWMWAVAPWVHAVASRERAPLEAVARRRAPCAAIVRRGMWAGR